MAEPNNTPPTTPQDQAKAIQPSLPAENGTANFRIDNRDNRKVAAPDISKRTIMTMITGGIGAVIGLVGAQLYVWKQFFDFEAEVSKMTQGNMMGAGRAATVGETFASPGLAAGAAHMEFRHNNAMALAKTKKYKLPSFVYENLGGERALIPLAAAAVTGTAAALIYLAMHPKKEEKDWTAKVATGKDQPPAIG